MLVSIISCKEELAPLSVVPQPNSIIYGEKNCNLHRINLNTIDDSFLKEYLIKGLSFSDVRINEKGIPMNMVQDFSLDSEAYQLIVSKKEVKIIAADYNGFLYGIQTLIQIIDQAKFEQRPYVVPCVTITDKPAFKWRGMHLDVCRHFFEVDFIKKMLDAMAMHKLNTFHWHLTEDQGWRIEIEKYPLLSEISAWRDESVVGHIATEPIQYDGKKYGGYYTKSQITEIVDYASLLGITIVPEIEMPGHAVAALMAYPELSCTGSPVAFNDWGISHDVYCAGNEKTFKFLEDVLSEVIELFPGELIHIGGDECPKTKWETCAKCQQRIMDENLKDEHHLQSYFIQRIEKFLNSKGKKIIGWDEILEGGLAENASVMSWRGEQGGIAAAQQGHNVVMTPNAICYLDHYQSDYYEPLAIAGLTTISEIYNWSVIPHALDEDKHHYILGAQGNVWTEYIPTEQHAEYMIYPRLCAIAEKVWTNVENQDLDDFNNRLNLHYQRLDEKGINFRLPYPKVEKYNPLLSENEKINLSNGVKTAAIYYTVDGTEPNENSLLFDEPFLLNTDQSVELKAVAILPSGRKSAVVSGKYAVVSPFKGESIDGLIQGIAYKKYNQLFQSAHNVGGTIDSEGIITGGISVPREDRKERFGVEYNGWIEVPEDGVYDFFLSVKDGGVLYMHDQLVVDNDGFKYGSTKSGKIALEAGLHPFAINYFMGRGWSELGLKYKVNGGEIHNVSANQFYTKEN